LRVERQHADDDFWNKWLHVYDHVTTARVISYDHVTTSGVIRYDHVTATRVISDNYVTITRVVSYDPVTTHLSSVKEVTARLGWPNWQQVKTRICLSWLKWRLSPKLFAKKDIFCELPVLPDDMKQWMWAYTHTISVCPRSLFCVRTLDPKNLISIKWNLCPRAVGSWAGHAMKKIEKNHAKVGKLITIKLSMLTWSYLHLWPPAKIYVIFSFHTQTALTTHLTFSHIKLKEPQMNWLKPPYGQTIEKEITVRS
jgi:hypothetical protein